jgi:hypothetical protein
VNNTVLGLISSVLVTIVAIAFAGVGGKVIDWVRKRNRG